MAAPSSPDPAASLPLGGMLAAVGLALLAVVLPLALWPLELPTLSHTYGRSYQTFELMGFFGGGFVIAWAAWALRRPEDWRAERVAPVAALAVATLYATGFVSEFSQASWDWSCYRDAGAAVLAGESPYARCYIYPPLFAQVLAGLFRVVAPVQEGLGAGLGDPWAGVFHVFQAGQVLAVALVALLGQRLARRWGMSPVAAAVLVAGLVVLDNPLLRTLRHDQINLWILAISLLAVDVVDRQPLVAGALVALAAHLKLYPLALLAPWMLAGRWKAVGAAVGMTAALSVAVTGRHPEQWAELAALGPKVAAGQYYRNNSLVGLVINLVRVPATLVGASVEGWVGLLRLVGMGASAVAGGLVGLRMLRRWRAGEAGAARLAADTSDVFALQLLVSPLVWEHHFVLALPVAWYAVARVGRTRPLLVALGVALMLWMPTADVWLLSHHRLVGLLLLLWATRGPLPASPPDAAAR